MKHKLLLTLIIILGVSLIAFSQDDKDEEIYINPVPENVMQEVVRRILIYKFKPLKRKKVIYLAQDGINQAWLPEITNVEFRLLSNEEIAEKENGVYFFKKSELAENKIYEIIFAFGDPDCDYLGDNWRFRFSANGKVRLWLDGGIGGGCGSSNDFGAPPERLNFYPNELKGYEFFDKGKIKGLRLTVSTREDVKNIFGDACETSCDYDENWKIYFSYFDNISFERAVNDIKTKYVPQAEFIGKLYSITLRPKSDILFDKVIFPSKYRKSYGFSASHDGIGGGTNSSYNSYEDRYGLIYTVLDEISLTTVKDLKWKKGELTEIEYTIPDKLEEKMFIEKN